MKMERDERKGKYVQISTSSKMGAGHTISATKQFRAAQQLKSVEMADKFTREGADAVMDINVVSGLSHGGECFRAELNSLEAAYLTRLLGSQFSLQADSKTSKRACPVSKFAKQQPIKNKSIERRPKKKAVPLDEDEIEAPQPLKVNSSRAVKANVKYFDEGQAIEYEKYNTNTLNKEPAPKRNTYEGVNEALRPCIRLLNLLKNSKTSWPFRQPVDPVAMNIPQYLEIIKEPMDLSKVEANLRANQYITPTQFHADVNKIIKNSYLFNQNDPQFALLTRDFEDYYRRITTEPNVQKSYSESHYDNYREKPPAFVKKKKSEIPYRETSEQQVITLTEKKQLGMNIKKLPKEQMKGIVDIVNQSKIKVVGEFDLKELEPAIIRKLQNYVREKLSAEKEKERYAEQNGMEEKESSFQIDEEEDS